MVRKRRASRVAFSSNLKQTRKGEQDVEHLGLSVAASVDYRQVMSPTEHGIKGFNFPQAEGFMCEIEYEARTLETVIDVGGEYYITSPEKIPVSTTCL
ncbi:unnamed protein product [Linum trigynum]|uniref:Uncharacterized protein n=1 Tax=Linum trigynum TaxID=586398 RepID=A0AAV2G853_9ROSI